MRLKHWAGRGSCCPRPYTWFRARFLYAILPADAGRWQTLRNPKTVGIFMLSSCPFYAVSVWVFVLLFCLIDKTDEYQLSQYILKFKTTQFLIGLFGLIQFASKMFYCLDGVNDFYDGVNVNGTHDRCVVAAPGQRPQDDYLIAMEPVRVGFVYLAWFLLWSGRAYGGKAELLALEHVVDAADGSLDGQLAKEKLKTNVNQKASGTTSEALYRAATKGARKLYDAKLYGDVCAQHLFTRRSSRYYRWRALKYFMLYDFFVLCTCCAGYAFIIVSNGYFRRGVGQNTFMFSVTLFSRPHCTAAG